MEPLTNLYPLTSLQIGDAQSYLSQAYLFFAQASHKFLILVDNHSWRMNNNHSASIHLRELLATKYRTSPFKNTRSLVRRGSARFKDTSISSDDERKRLYKWVSFVNSRRWRVIALFPLVDLHVALHGFIVFEVSWNDMRGINYYNVLQMDASMAFEVKSMRKLDFHSIRHASSCILSWFSGSPSETRLLLECLMFLNDNIPSHSPRKIGVSFNESLLDDRKQVKGSESFDVKECAKPSEEKHEQKTPTTPLNAVIESVQYKDTLLKFYFNNRDLPFTFKEIITSDLRLLTLLEAGLPSWVIFLQSYPLFCKVYRPWMRPLVRILYILISFVTCMIGFYDLYKNVPLLKASASHICGPLFNWIEESDMISRIRYLGTMLFLQNFERAIKWFLKTGRVLKLLFLVLTKPLKEPLQDLMEFASPVWLLFYDAGSGVYDALYSMVISICSLFAALFQPLISPFLLLYSYLTSIVPLLSTISGPRGSDLSPSSYTVAFFRPLFYSLWKLCQVPLGVCAAMGNHAASFCTDIYEVLEGWLVIILNRVTEIGHLAVRLFDAKPTTNEVSMWNSLWNDLFSKLFRALRSVLYGLIAFLDSFNRHRLSTSNQLRKYRRRMSRFLSSGMEESPPALLLAESCQKEVSENHDHVD